MCSGQVMAKLTVPLQFGLHELRSNAMTKKIAIFLDGTYNQARGIQNEQTNVWRLFEECNAEPDGDITQNCHVKKYLPGVGTTGRPGPYCNRTAIWSTLKHPGDLAIWLAGGAGGWGIGKQITDAYRYLSQQYENARGAEVYLFGFSRGAFAARSLSGFVDQVGLLLKGCDAQKVGNAFALYQTGEARERSLLQPYLKRMVGARSPGEGQNLPIYFIGVWDTVASLGLPRWLEFLTRPNTDYHKVELPSNVTYARHALALHEMRPEFRPTLWRGTNPRNPRQSLVQCWFAGAHADVGGGYHQNGLEAIALAWMRDEALSASSATASLFPGPFRETPNVLTLRINQEMGVLAKLMGSRYRTELKKPLELSRDILGTMCVHRTARSRLGSQGACDYGQFPHPMAEALREVDEHTKRLAAVTRLYGGPIC